MLYKPYNLVPSSKLGSIVYANDEKNYEFNYQGSGANIIDKQGTLELKATEKLTTNNQCFLRLNYTTNFTPQSFDWAQWNVNNGQTQATSIFRFANVGVAVPDSDDKKYWRMAIQSQYLSQKLNYFYIQNNANYAYIDYRSFTRKVSWANAPYTQDFEFYNNSIVTPTATYKGLDHMLFTKPPDQIKTAVAENSEYSNLGLVEFEDTLNQKIYITLKNTIKISTATDTTPRSLSFEQSAQLSADNFTYKGKEIAWSGTITLPGSEGIEKTIFDAKFTFMVDGGNHLILKTHHITNIVNGPMNYMSISNNSDTDILSKHDIEFFLSLEQINYAVNEGLTVYDEIEWNETQLINEFGEKNIITTSISETNEELLKLFKSQGGVRKLYWRLAYKEPNSLNKVYSNWEIGYFLDRKPNVDIGVTPINLTTYQFTGALNNTTIENISNFKWELFLSDRLIYQTKKIYSSNCKFIYYNFLLGYEYKIKLTIEDNYNQVWSDTYTLNLQNEEYESNGLEENDVTLTVTENNQDTGVRVNWITNSDKQDFIGYNIKRFNPENGQVVNCGVYYFSKNPTTNERVFIDFSLPHQESAKYLIYPIGKSQETKTNSTSTDNSNENNLFFSGINENEIIYSPIQSEKIQCEWDKWCLFTTIGPSPKDLGGDSKQGYNDDVLLVDKIFFFEMNVETGTMKNNTDFSIVKNFTSYPMVQRSPSNYWSGQLKGLLGRLSLTDSYIQNPSMLQEIKELTQNTSRKFLKDKDGNFWEVELSSDITIDNNDKLDIQLKTKSFNWVEVGDASNISLIFIGNNFVSSNWLLTETGISAFNMKYEWKDTELWNDNKIWTEAE